MERDEVIEMIKETIRDLITVYEPSDQDTIEAVLSELAPKCLCKECTNPDCDGVIAPPEQDVLYTVYKCSGHSETSP